MIVSPAPGEPGKTPFWHGDAAGRPIELGRALGEFSRRIVGMDDGARAGHARSSDHKLDELAARNLLAYLAEQKAATGVVPSDRTIVVERFRDELGDWRVCILTPFGGRVHAPWALAIGAAVRERLGVDLYAIWTDDGIAMRLPEGLEDGADRRAAVSRTPSASEDLVVRELSGSALFASRFRENAARALLLPRRRGDARTPLWQMRQRASDLMAVASRYGSFPILLETYRECLQDVFDLPALQEVLRGIQQRQIRVTSVETASASPFARSLLFDYIAEYMYEGDAPMAERRAQALALDRERLRELLGQEELRELLDPSAVDELELELQWLGERRARTPDQLHDLLRRVGDLSSAEVAARTPRRRQLGRVAGRPGRAARRAVQVRIGGEERWVAVEDVARYRDAVGVQPPRGVPEIFLQTERRRARQPAAALGAHPLRRSPRASRPPAGACRPRWCTTRCAASKRRAPCCAASSDRAAPNASGATPTCCARCAAARWPACGEKSSPCQPRRSAASCRPGTASAANRAASTACSRSSASSKGCSCRGRCYERDVLRRARARLPAAPCSTSCAPAASWCGSAAARSAPTTAAWRCFVASVSRCWRRSRPKSRPTEPIHQRIREHLAGRGASFFREIFQAAGGPTDAAVLDALWDLVWSGELTNDTLAPLRLRLLRRGRGRAGPVHLSRTGPPEAAGRWSLVPIASRRHRPRARPGALAARTARRGHPRVGARRGRARRLRGRLPRAARHGGGGQDPARLLRRGPRRRPVRAARRRRPPARRAHARRRPHRPGAGRGRSGQPVRRDAGLAEVGRKTKLQRVGGAYVVLVDGEPALYVERSRKGLVTLPAFEQHAPARGGRACGAWPKTRRGASSASNASTANPCSPRPLRPLLEQAGFQREYLGLTLRLPALEPSSGAECLKATRSFRRPPRCGPSWSASRSSPPAPARPAPRSTASSAATSPRSSRSASTCSIRFDNGLALHTHLRMAGTWHRYAPGERWRIPAWKARVVLEVPDHVVVCFNAPVVELMDDRAVDLHPALAVARPRPARRRLFEPTLAFAAASRPAPTSRSPRPCSTSASWPASATSSKARSCSSSRSIPWTHVSGSDDATLRAPDRHGPPPAARQRRRPAIPQRVTTRGDPSARGQRLWVYGRANRPCTPLRRAHPHPPPGRSIDRPTGARAASRA